MSKIALVIDSTCYLPKEVISKHKLNVVSLNVVIDNVSYPEVEIDNKMVFDGLKNNLSVTTSQPAPGEYYKTFTRLHEEGYEHVVCILLSSGLSGTYQSCLVAKNMMENEDINIHVIDQKLAAFGVENIVLEAIKMLEEDKDIDSILNRLNAFRNNGELLFTLQTLYYVYKGGRLSRMQAAVGTLLRIKPIIEMIDGKLALTKKSRTNKAVIEYFMSKIDFAVKKYKTVFVRLISLNNDEYTDKIKQDIENKYENAKVTVTKYLGPVFSTHLGDNGFGLSYVGE